MKTILTFIFTTLFYHTIFSQGIAAEIGYKYKYTNTLTTGLVYRISKENNNNPINVNCLFTTNFKNNNLISIGVQKRFSMLFEGGLNISNKDAEPTLGVNLLNFIKMNAGYSIPFNKHKTGQLTFGFSIMIGQEYYYDNFKMRFM